MYELGADAVTHTFSCESDRGKQRWIREFCAPCPNNIFDDVTTFHQTHSYCILNGRTSLVPYADWVYIGFSCKDISHLNKLHASALRSESPVPSKFALGQFKFDLVSAVLCNAQSRSRDQ